VLFFIVFTDLKEPYKGIVRSDVLVPFRIPAADTRSVFETIATSLFKVALSKQFFFVCVC
jgi:hypothetical protein